MTLTDGESQKGYDLIDKHKWLKVEVKRDSWTLSTGNLALEIWSHIDKRNEGWMQYSDADILSYLMCEKETKSPRLLALYRLAALKDFVLFNCLEQDWFCSAPKMGRISDARFSHNTHVRNLLLPRSHAQPFLLREIKVGDAISE